MAQLAGMLGPALLMGGAAIGGGEWLVGPTVTARLTAARPDVAGTITSWAGADNIEISRYTLYTGEPIFHGQVSARCLDLISGSSCTCC